MIRLGCVCAALTAYLHLLLVQVDLRDDGGSLTLVGLGVGEIGGIENSLVLRTVSGLATKVLR